MVCAKVNQIISAMVASCMNPQEIADTAGVSVNIVYRMRRGYLVKMDSFGKICRALGINPDDVIDFDRMDMIRWKYGNNAGPEEVKR